MSIPSGVRPSKELNLACSYAVYIALDFVWLAILYYFFPETKGLTIEEVSLVCDYSRKGARQHAAHDLQALTRQGGGQDVEAEGASEGGEKSAAVHVDYPK